MGVVAAVDSRRMASEASPWKRRTPSEALRAAVQAWSPRSYEARLVFAALVSGILAAWAHLSSLWAVISAILILQPDPVETRRNSLLRFAATLIGGAASVGIVALGAQGIWAFILAMVVTCTVCAALGLEEGLRPACVTTAVLLIRPQSELVESAELRFAFQRILAVLAGGAVALAVAYLPGWRPDAGTAARGGATPSDTGR